MLAGKLLMFFEVCEVKQQADSQLKGTWMDLGSWKPTKEKQRNMNSKSKRSQTKEAKRLSLGYFGNAIHAHNKKLLNSHKKKQTKHIQKILLQRPWNANFSIYCRTNQISSRWSLGTKFHQCCHLGCPQTLQCFHGTYQIC